MLVSPPGPRPPHSCGEKAVIALETPPRLRPRRTLPYPGGSPISTLVLATKAFAAGAALEGVLPRLVDEVVIVLLCNGALDVSETLSNAQV